MNTTITSHIDGTEGKQGTGTCEEISSFGLGGWRTLTAAGRADVNTQPILVAHRPGVHR
jgi:hypothetical protein